MAEDRLDSLFDLSSLSKEFDFAKANVKELMALIAQFKQKGMIEIPLTKNLSDFQKIKAEIDALSKAIGVNTKTSEELVNAHKKLSSITKQLTKDVANHNAKITEENKLLRLNAAVHNAARGSMEKARAEIAKLTFQRDRLNLTTEKGRAQLEKVNLQIDAHNKFIQSNLDLDGQRIKNIGNYTGQLGVLGRSVRAFGSLQGTISDALNISPEAGLVIHEVGQALLELSHVKHAESLFTKEQVAADKAHTASKAADTVVTSASSKVTEVNTEVKGANTVATEVNTEGTKAATLAQRLYTLVVGESTGALKILRIALAATGIGLLILGLVALVSYLNKASAANLSNVSSINKSKEAHTSLRKEMDKTSESAEELRKRKKLLSETFEDAAKSASEEVIKLRLYALKLNDLNIPLSERVKVAKEYNKVADDGNKIDLTQINNLDLINKKITEQNALIIKRALSTAALSKLTEAGNKLIDAQLELDNELRTNGKTEDDINKRRIDGINNDIDARNRQIQSLDNYNSSVKVLKTSAQVQEAASGITTKALTKEERALVSLLSKRDAANEELKRLTNDLSSLITPEGLTTGGGGGEDKNKKDTKTELFKQLQEERKAIYDGKKAEIQAKIEADKVIINDDKKTFEERLQAAKDFYSDSLDLTKLNKDFLETDADKEAEEDRRKANVDKELVKNKVDLNNTLNAVEKNKLAKELQATQQFNTDILKVTEENEKQLFDLKTKHDQELEAHRKAEHEFNLDDIKISYEARIQAENESYEKELKAAGNNKSKIKKIEKNHAEFLLASQLKFNIESLKEDIRYTKGLLSQAEVRANLPGASQADKDAVIKVKKDLATLEISLDKTVTDYYIESNKNAVESDEQRAERHRKMWEDIAGYAQRGLEIIQGFSDAAAEREKQRIQERLDLIDKQKDKDIAAANQQILNATDRDRAIKEIEARAEQRKDQLEAKQRAAELRRARFEKAANIASIIMETALSVMRALSDKTVPYPVRLGYAITAGVLGAAEIAKVVATPLPKYKDGTNFAKGGPSIVGDGGKSEAIVTPDGKIYKTPSVDTIVDIPRGSKVYPDYTKAMLGAGNLIPGLLKKSYTENNTVLNKGFKSIVEAIKNKKETHLELPARWNNYMQEGHYFKRYLNKNL